MVIKSRTELVKLMKHLNLPLVAAEIGVAEGILSGELLEMGIEKLYLIDIWETMPFLDGCASFDQSWHDDNYKQVTDKFGNDTKVVILKGFSHKMAKLVEDESLGMIYLDASHDKKSARSDLEIWVPKLVTGGICAGHDYLNPAYGVKGAVTEFTENKMPVYILEEEQGEQNAGFYFIKQ